MNTTDTDPTLTERARAVLAELDDEQDVADACAAIAMLQGACVYECPSRGFDLAEEYGLIRFDMSQGRSRWVVLDLGREAARLLAEGTDR